MTKTVFLHIGLHKTGTTALQTVLFNHRRDLTEHDVSFFCRKPSGDYGTIHTYLDYHQVDKVTGASLCHQNKLRQFIEEDSHSKVVISSEQFSWISNAAVISELKELLEPFKVQIIMYLRRQDLQAISHWQEAAKYEGGLLKPAKSYYGFGPNRALPAFREEEIKGSYLDYHARYELWRSVFGTDAITVRIFERSSLKNGDIVSDFLELIDVPWQPPTKHRANTSINLDLFKFGHLMTEVTGKIDKELESQLRRAVWQASNGGKALPARAEAEQFYEMFRDSNRNLARELGGNHKKELFGIDFTHYPIHSADTWDEESANSVIATILKCLAERYPEHRR